LLKEDFPLNPLTHFEKYCDVKLQFINSQYLRVTHMGIDDILEGKIKLNELYNALSDIDSECSSLRNRTDDYINNLLDDDLDVRVDQAYDKITYKLDALMVLVNSLNDIQEHGEIISKQFGEIKPLDVTN